MKNGKQRVVTFKADEELVEAIKRLPNRSEFIRAAILQALDSSCPLCNGTGILNPNQMNHWKVFMRDHIIEECGKCHEARLVCENRPKGRRKQETH